MAVKNNNLIALVKQKLGKDRDRDIQQLLKPYL